MESTATHLDGNVYASRSATTRGIVETGERAARRSLRAQIARLERELGAAFVTAYPRLTLDCSVPGYGGPRLLSIGELERIRDDLVDRLAAARAALAHKAEAEEVNRRLIEAMLLEPGHYKYVRVTNADIGERGCKSWHVRPRAGVLGILLGWWRVKISSGCPLPRGVGRVAAARRAPDSHDH